MLGLGAPTSGGAAHSTRTRWLFGSCRTAVSWEERRLAREGAGWRPPSRCRGCRRSRSHVITSLLVGADGKPTLGSSPVRVYDLSKPSSNRVVAEALVHAPAEQVWEVLTDYERLAEFIPNLDSCKRVPCPKPGRVWVVQRACSQSLLWRLEAEAVLEVVEEAQAGVLGRREVRFSLVEGDFKELHGRWVVEPAGMACLLRYDITVVPKLPLPATIVNHVVRTGLPANILALAQRAEQIAAERLKPASIAAWAGLEDDAPLPGQQQSPGQELVLDEQQLLEQPVPGFQPEEQQVSVAAAAAAAAAAAVVAADCPPGSEAVGPACVFSEQDTLAQEQGLGNSQPGLTRDSSSIKGSSNSSAAEEQQQPLPQTAAASAASASVVRWWEQSDDALPCSGPFWSRMSKFAASAPLTAAIQRRRLGKLDPPPSDARSTYLGLSSVPLPGPLSLAGSLRAGPPREPDLQARFNESQRQKELLQEQASYPAFGLQRPGRTAAAARERARGSNSSSSSSAVAGNTLAPGAEAAPGAAAGSSTVLIPASAELEVHLRRLDGFDYLHRRAVAAITIDAPPEQVWRVLTDYDSLAEFVPNLAVSQRIALPAGAPPNVVRVRQVGYKRVLYMAMHAESVLDLVEKPISEVQFRQVAGDFERFQGKWMLQEVPPLASEDWGDSMGAQTQLKYAVELVMPRATRLLGIMEPVLERCVFEDMPANLAAIKRRVEALQADRERAGKLAEAEELELAGQPDKAAALRKRAEVPRPREMYEDFGVLAAELERCFGADKVLPSRTELREMNRYDLEKAIAAHGGPAAVAQALGWSAWGGRKRNRKPRGYWDSPDNLRAAIDEFIAEHELEPGVMPVKNQLVRAGRYDIARAVEKWGGVAEVAERLGYAIGLGGKEQWYSHVKQVAREKGLSGSEGLFEEAAKTYGRGATATSSRDSSSSGSLSSLSSIDFDDGWSVMRDGGGDSAGVVLPSDYSQRVSKTQESSRLGEPGMQQQVTAAGKAGAGNGKGPLPGRQPRSRQPGSRKQMASGMGSVRQEIDSW